MGAAVTSLSSNAQRTETHFSIEGYARARLVNIWKSALRCVVRCWSAPAGSGGR